MAQIKPFAAIRPSNGLEEQVAALPYDVYNRMEAKHEIKHKPYSFLRVDRPETSFEDSVGTYDACVYEKAKELFTTATFAKEAMDAFKTLCEAIGIT